MLQQKNTYDSRDLRVSFFVGNICLVYESLRLSANVVSIKDASRQMETKTNENYLLWLKLKMS